MEENTSLHTECAHKPRPAVLNQFSRTELLLGEDNMQRLFNARVAVFGIGGVGGYTVEALARVGVGTLDLIDDDRVCLTNLNRQIFLAVFERIYPNNISLTQNAVFDMATYTLILAFGQTILFRVNASSGGTDIIAKIVNKYTHMDLGKACTLVGLLICTT